MPKVRINAGKYRHIITFQRLRDNPNSYGEVPTTNDTNWEDAFTVRAGIFPISGKEVLTDEVKNGEISHRILIRYTHGIESNMRIKFGNRIFLIVSPPINFQEMNLEMQLLCKERENSLIGAN